MIIHNQRQAFPEPLKEVYTQFLKETEEELWIHQSELLKFIKGSEETLNEYINGKRGNNVFYTARAIVLVHYVKELHDVAFSALKEVLKNHKAWVSDHLENYLIELKKYSELRKKNPLSDDRNGEALFHYDFLKLEKEAFQTVPKEKLQYPLLLKFIHTEKQQKHLVSQLNAYGHSRVGMARLIGKNPVKKFYRTPYVVEPTENRSLENFQEKIWQDIS